MESATRRMSYNYKRILELIELEKESYKKDFTSIKDMDKNYIAIVIVNALNRAKKDIEKR
jgi:hypothetical protein